MPTLLLDFVLSGKGRIKTKIPLQVKTKWILEKIFRKIFRIVAVFLAEREKFKKTEENSYSITIWNLKIQEKLIINQSKWESMIKTKEIGSFMDSSERISEVLTCQIEAFHEKNKLGLQAFLIRKNGSIYSFLSNQGNSFETRVFWKKPIFTVVRPKIKKAKESVIKHRKEPRNKISLEKNLVGEDLMEFKYKIRSCIKCSD